MFVEGRKRERERVRKGGEGREGGGRGHECREEGEGKQEGRKAGFFLKEAELSPYLCSLS